MLKSYRGLGHLKSMNITQLKKLSVDIRKEIISTVSKSGGHIASSLGAVELAIALHYVFDSPEDAIIWDVGHQAYAHKILTGRDLSTLRIKGGISGFPKPDESVHDPFIAGHAGISISEASGLAKLKPDNFAIAVIGDGSMTAGVVYEAMNHAGSLNLSNLIVILNDNEMSISKNVGAISSFFSNNIVSTTYYQKIRSEIKSLISSVPFQKTFNIDLVNIIKKIRSSAVNLIAPDSFFETFGFRYVGPFDGHDLEVLVKMFRNIPAEEKDSPPLLFHVVTKKGKGFGFAEDNPSTFHGISAFNAKTGKVNSISKLPSFTSVFGNTIVKIAGVDERVLAITAAMKEGTGLEPFEKKFPERFYDVGIAEQHAVTFAAGLAKAGAKPVVAIYSTFLQRSLDQVIHDVALNRLPIVFCLDRAGMVGEDGATHHGIFDLSYLRNIPGITIMAPSTARELELMLYWAISRYNEPVFIRYPRGAVPSWEFEQYSRDVVETIDRGKSRIIFEHNAKKDYVVIFALGFSAYIAKLAAENFVRKHPDAGLKVYDARFVKPLDKKTVLYEMDNSKAMITVEENVLAGGFGSSVLECTCDEIKTVPIPVYRLGIGDEFIEQATTDELRSQTNIDVQSVYNIIGEVLGKETWFQGGVEGGKERSAVLHETQ